MREDGGYSNTPVTSLTAKTLFRCKPSWGRGWYNRDTHSGQDRIYIYTHLTHTHTHTHIHTNAYVYSHSHFSNAFETIHPKYDDNMYMLRGMLMGIMDN